MKLNDLRNGAEVSYRVGKVDDGSAGIVWKEWHKGILRIERLTFNLPKSMVWHDECAKKGDVCVIDIEGETNLESSILDFITYRKDVSGCFMPAGINDIFWQIDGLDGF